MDFPVLALDIAERRLRIAETLPRGAYAGDGLPALMMAGRKGGQTMRAWLREVRTENELTQAEVARRLGMSEAQYSRIENGLRKKNVDVDFIIRLADAIGIDKMALLERAVRAESSMR